MTIPFKRWFSARLPRAAAPDPAAARLVELTQRAEAAEARVVAALAAQTEILAGAGRRKDAFLIMLAHELRNPLGPMRSAVAILERDQDGAAAERSRAILARQVMHMSRLVDDLVDVSRIMHGQISLQPLDLDVVALVQQVAEDHRDEMVELRHGLSLRLPLTPIWIRGDPDRLHQVLDNLLSNAVKFSEPGDEIIVELRRSSRLGQVLLTVTDPGIGIDSGEIAGLFESFIQADLSLARSRGGLGLGLAVARGLVELHGGQIWGESSGLGRGASFTVSLPLVERRPRVEEPGVAARRVLIIEDNVDAATLLEDFVAILGYQVMVAYTGPLAVERAREFGPHVVLCDLGLPGFDGYEVARRLRADPEFEKVLLIAVTGYGGAPERAASQVAGFDHHLVKPIDLEQLTALLSGA